MTVTRPYKIYLLFTFAILLVRPELGLALGSSGEVRMNPKLHAEALLYKERFRQALLKIPKSWIENGGIEVITGGPSYSKTESYFGHSALRLVGSGGDALNDFAIEILGILPTTNSWVATAYNGLGGVGPVTISVVPMSNLIGRYFFEQMRGITRMIIPSNPALRRTLISTLLKFNDEKVGNERYYFLTNNCASVLQRLLEDAGFVQVSFPKTPRPAQLPIFLRYSYVAPWPEMTGISSQDIFRFKDLSSIQHWDAISTLELQRILHFRRNEVISYLKQIATVLRSRKDQAALDVIYGLRPPADFLYQSTLDPLLQDQHTKLKNEFSPVELSKAIRHNSSAMRSTARFKVCAAAPEQCQYFNKAQQLLKTIR